MPVHGAQPQKTQENEVIGMLRYYHYRKLSPAGQATYKIIVLSLKKFSSCAVIDSVENLQTVLEAAKNDNPHLFFVNWYDLKYRVEFQGLKTVVHFSYLMGRPEALELWQRAKQIAPALRGSTDKQTIRNVHDYLAARVHYDHNGTKGKNFRLRDHTMAGALFDDLAVCEGIARAAQFLLRELRVECTYQCGYLKEARGYHAWNLVSIDGQVLKMDVTWDLAASNGGRLSHRYFCTNLAR